MIHFGKKNTQGTKGQSNFNYEFKYTVVAGVLKMYFFLWHKTDHCNGFSLTYLPVLSYGIPHTHFPRMTSGHQLVANEEESIDRNSKTEHSY